MSILALVVIALAPSLSFVGRAEEPRPEITRLVADLDVAVKKDGKEDAKAIEIVDRLASMHEKCTPEEREAIAKQVGRALRDPRRRPDKKTHESRLATASARALGSMGDAGAKELVPALALKHFEDNGPLLEDTLAELGRTRSKAAIAPMLELAGDRELHCRRGTARGFAHWGEADGATRKKLFEALFKPMQSLADEARSAGPGTEVAKDIFEGARDVTYDALAALSRDTGTRDIDGWLAWWNDHKNKSWDAKQR
jgi:hypothetical protein